MQIPLVTALQEEGDFEPAVSEEGTISTSEKEVPPKPSLEVSVPMEEKVNSQRDAK